MDLQARNSVGIHWGTFQLTSEPILEPPKLLEEAKRQHGINAEAFVVLDHGETRRFLLHGTTPVDVGLLGPSSVSDACSLGGCSR